MKNISSPLLPFKLEITNDKITSHSGLAIFGEFLHSQRITSLINENVQGFDSQRGYKASSYVTPLLLMLNGGGRYIEDVRNIAFDDTLTELLGIENIPSTASIGKWLSFVGDNEDRFLGLSKVNKAIVEQGCYKSGKDKFTLDIDASQIVAYKKTSMTTYKGKQGYMPIIGHIAETGMVVHEEFRDGNVSPNTRNLEFIEDCFKQMPEKKKFTRIRADAASYQASIFNYCEDNNLEFAIGGRMDSSVKTIIKELEPEAWQPYQEYSKITTVTHCMEETNKAFNLIIIRRPYQPTLFEEDKDNYDRYVLIATNIKGKAPTIVKWYNQRSEASENRIKELKIGFNMEYMPCGKTQANAVYFRIGVLGYNLFKLFNMAALPDEWSKHTVQTIRWKFYNSAAKLVAHAGTKYLKVKKQFYGIFKEVRARIREFALNAT